MSRNDQPTNHGEGNAKADRAYRERTANYLENNDVEADAKRAARALEGPEGDALRAAQERAKQGPTGDGTIDRIYGKVAQLRDEAKLEAHLAKKEAQDTLVELEKKWGEVQAKADMIADASSSTAQELKSSLNEMLAHLDEGYRRIKNQVA